MRPLAAAAIASLAFAAATAVTGAVAVEPRQGDPRQGDRVAAASSGSHARVRFGESVRGATLKARRLGDRDSRRKALVVGSIHGDETAGHRVIEELRRRRDRIGGVDLWTVRTVNPDGVAAGTRRNDRGVDLNRNFPYRWRGEVPASSGYYPGPHPLSEPESRAVVRLVKRLEPAVTIWYHQPWGAVLLPCRGPAPLERRYARIARFPTDRCRGEHLRGTATSWQEHRVGGTAFVVELPAAGLSRPAAHRHARAAAAVAMGDRVNQRD
jgi:protein MpaA